MMFPPARNAHRRLNNNSTNDESKQKIPIPIAVTLHNLMVVLSSSEVAAVSSSANDYDKEEIIEGSSTTTSTTRTKPPPPPPPPSASAPSSASKWFRPDHIWSLVPKIRLEIVVGGDNNNEEDNASSSSSSSSSHHHRVVYSNNSDIQSVHPTWEHIDERIDLPDEWWLSDSGVYKNMKLRFRIIKNSTSSTDDDEHEHDGNNNNSNVFLEVPLYPSKLERLNIDNNKNNNNNSNNSDGRDGKKNHPDALPPNSCFVYFSDGSTRLPMQVFQILLDCQMAQPPPIENFSRFEDDAFSVLDNVEQHKMNRDRAISASSLLIAAGNNAAVVEGGAGAGATPSSNNQENNHHHHHHHHTTRVQQTLLVDNDDDQPKSQVAATTTAFSETAEQDALFEDLESERSFLLAMIAKEEAAIEQEMVELQEEKKLLENQLQKAKMIERDIELVQKEMNNQEIQLHRERFVMDAQRVKLMKELKTIYPLTLDSLKGGYTIRSLRLPVDIYTTSVVEDEISGAINFTCHLIFMICKYMSINLPYRIYCNSSRSVIQSDGLLYPLGKGIPREQLEQGILLLNANVDCMLLTYQINFTPKSHILARLKRLFDAIIEGDEKENNFS